MAEAKTLTIWLQRLVLGIQGNNILLSLLLTNSTFHQTQGRCNGIQGTSVLMNHYEVFCGRGILILGATIKVIPTAQMEAC